MVGYGPSLIFCNKNRKKERKSPSKGEDKLKHKFLMSPREGEGVCDEEEFGHIHVLLLDWLVESYAPPLPWFSTMC